MKFFKPVFLMALLGVMAGCGTSQPPTVNLGNGYTNPNGQWNQWNNWPNGTQTGGWTTSLPGGGTKQIIPVISYYGYANSSKQFMVYPTVQAGDQVEVAASNAQVAAQGLIGSSNMLWLTQLKVSLNGSLLGASSYARYNISQGGSLTLQFEANGLSGLFGNNAQYNHRLPIERKAEA